MDTKGRLLLHLPTIDQRVKTNCKDAVMAGAKNATIYNSDLFIMGVASRTLANSSAFRSVVEQNNYMVAAALVRLQLDTLARLWACTIVKDMDEFCSSVLAGEQINKMIDQDGRRMTDRNLVGKLEALIPTVEPVYARTSGFVHLSGSHVFGTVIKLSDDGKVEFFVGPVAPNATMENWKELVLAFEHFTNVIADTIARYGEIKSEGMKTIERGPSH